MATVKNHTLAYVFCIILGVVFILGSEFGMVKERFLAGWATGIIFLAIGMYGLSKKPKS
ncbi:MAG: hypothetical protein V1909_05075 [Candidatus Micrarchaeota archaeon]